MKPVRPTVFLVAAMWATPALAQVSQGLQPIEFVLHEGTGAQQPAFEVVPVDPASPVTFSSQPFLVLTVPPSSKQDGVFIEVWAQAFFSWTNLQTRRVRTIVWLRGVSPVIPPGVEVLNGLTVVEVHETNLAGDADLATRRSQRSYKFPMRRSRLDDWIVREISTGNRLPEDEAVAILADLLEAGFQVELSADGYLRGVQRLFLLPVDVEVTRARGAAR